MTRSDKRRSAKRVRKVRVRSPEVSVGSARELFRHSARHAGAVDRLDTRQTVRVRVRDPDLMRNEKALRFWRQGLGSVWEPWAQAGVIRPAVAHQTTEFVMFSAHFEDGRVGHFVSPRHDTSGEDYKAVAAAHERQPIGELPEGVIRTVKRVR